MQEEEEVTDLLLAEEEEVTDLLLVEELEVTDLHISPLNPHTTNRIVFSANASRTTTGGEEEPSEGERGKPRLPASRLRARL